jgi:hypothetical protein
MAWQFSSTPIQAQEKVMVVLGYGLYIVGVLNFLPEEMRYLLMSSTWPVMLYARGSQVLATFQVKHTGQLSIVTTSMNLVGSLIRIGTTLKETGDMVVLSGYILSGVLSFLMFVQVRSPWDGLWDSWNAINDNTNKQTWSMMTRSVLFVFEQYPEGNGEKPRKEERVNFIVYRCFFLLFLYSLARERVED